jgi:hypothetical protein
VRAHGLSSGRRHLLTTDTIAPFAGAGRGILWIGMDGESVATPYGYDEQTELYGSGIAPYLEAGIELLRFYESRVDLFVRVDAPLYELSPEYDEDIPDQYALPVSIMASYSFD